MDNVKKFKKGDILFRENDPVQNLLVIQSGKVSLQIERAGKKLEVLTAGPGQVLGEQALFYNARQAFTAEVVQECKVMEIPLEGTKTQLQGVSSVIKILSKSMVDELKNVRLALRSAKMESDKSPCPQPAIPRIFALLNLVARHAGKPIGENALERELDWGALKLYATRMFAESPQRIRSLLDLLLKLKWAELTFQKNDDGEDELSKIRLKNIQVIEDFAEFYQFHLYKGGYSEMIHVDTLALKVARALVELSQGLELDRKGVANLNWDQLIGDMKQKYHLDLKNTHLDALEKKGLFVKRQSRENAAAVLAFDFNEFQKTVVAWTFIHEIDKWNEKGFVDLKEKEVEILEGKSGCPQCRGAVDGSHKFCPHCGFKLAAAA